MLKLRTAIPRFFNTGELFFGAGSAAVLGSLGANRVAVVVSDSVFRQDEMSAILRRALGSTDHQFLTKPSGEPTLEVVRGLACQMREYNPDWIVAVGGGSVLDAAKLAWVLYEIPDTNVSHWTRPFSVSGLRGRARLAALPTTSGTGSEVSSSAVYFDSETSRKNFVISHELLPDVIVLDPRLACKVPPLITATAAMDALAHAVEGYVSKLENPFLDSQAESAVRTIFEYLPTCVDSPDDLHSRSQLMIAALLAGWVQNFAVPGVGHAVAHQLARFGASHSLACGVMLAPSMRFNSQNPKALDRYQRLGAVIGAHGIDGFARRIQDLQERTGTAGQITRFINQNRESIRRSSQVVAQDAMLDICARANPVQLTESNLALLVSDTFYGGHEY